MRGVRGGTLLTVVAVLGVCLPLAGCANSDLKAATDTSKRAVEGHGCSLPSPSAELPADFPQLPLLPTGAVVTSVDRRSGGRTVVGAVVQQRFEDLLKDTRARYGAAGLVLDHGEVEEHDAESNFHGQGLEGRWGLRSVPDCPGSSTVSLVVAAR